MPVYKFYETELSNYKIRWNKLFKKFSLYNDQNKKIGCLQYNHFEDGTEKRNVEIAWVYITPKFRRCGYAYKLIQCFLNQFENNRTWISLWTSANAEKSNSYKLYYKLGFKEAVILNDYYEDNVPARMFIKRGKLNAHH